VTLVTASTRLADHAKVGEILRVALKTAKVVAEFAQRRERIRAGVVAAARRPAAPP